MVWKLLLVSLVMGTVGVISAPIVLAMTNLGGANPASIEKLPEIKPTPIVSGKPIQIIVPSLGIDLPVVDGVYDPQAHTWSLGKHTAQFAVTTPFANDTSGNTFIYGHNSQYVFNKLLYIETDAEVQIVTDNNKVFTYRYKKNFDVQPQQVDSIKHTGAPMLTIQTCVGQYLEQRRMFQFDFIKVTDKV